MQESHRLLDLERDIQELVGHKLIMPERLSLMFPFLIQRARMEDQERSYSAEARNASQKLQDTQHAHARAHDLLSRSV